MALGTFTHSAQAQKTDFATFSVNKVKAAGTFDVVLVTVDKKGTVTPVTKTITVVAAEKIATAFGAASGVGGVNPANTAQVQYDVTASGNASAGIRSSTNSAVSYTTDTENRVAFLPPPNERLAQFAFAPNPGSGLSTLPTAATITAGFAAGISPVTFTAPANTDLDGLASLLDSALMGGGYLTSMPDPTDVVVFADGVGLPVEVDFILEPIERTLSHIYR